MTEQRVSSEILDRLPPQSLAAEKAVLGSIMLDPRVADSVSARLKPDDFYADAHRRVFARLLAMRDARQPIDGLTLLDSLRGASELEAVGGVEYLAELAQSVPVACNALYYAGIVADRAARRNVIQAMTECLRDAYGNEGDAIEEMLGRVENALGRIRTGEYSGEPKPVAQSLQAVIERADAIRERGQSAGILTGLWDWDERIGGLFPGEFTVLAARPGVGKTALATAIARHVASGGRLTYFASLEMSDLELIQRVLCCEANVDSRKIRTATLDAADSAALAKAANRLAGDELVIHDRPGLSVADIRRSCRRLKPRGLSFIVVDYLQRITPADRKAKRYEQVADIAKELKTLARELSVPVLCLAQLGREAETVVIPELRHLRESGDIEAECDVVAFLVRPMPWDAEQAKTALRGKEKPPADQAGVIVAKNRNGPLLRLKLRWEAQRTRFVPPEHQEAYDEFSQYGGEEAEF